jgi:ubiquinol oxidase
MSSRMAGSILLRHAGPRLFATTATSPAVAASRPLLAPGDGFPAIMVRLMSTSSSAAVSEAKKEAAKGDGEKREAAKGGGEKKKEVVINSYWGIDQSNKLVRADGTEWKWTCFKVRQYVLSFVIRARFDFDSVLPFRFVPAKDGSRYWLMGQGQALFLGLQR